MSGGASMTPSGYCVPPSEILEVMRAPAPPVPIMSPTGDRMILVTWHHDPAIERVATPYLRLAGVRVVARNHSRHDTPGGSGVALFARGFDLVRVADGAEVVHVALPADACPTRPVWSPNGTQFAFENVTSDSVELWIGDGQTGEVRRVPDVRLNQMLNHQFQWMPDQKTLLVKLVPQIGPAPSKPVIPTGPSIQESYGQKGQSSTYEARDTLNSPHDEDVFDYYAASQLAFVDTTSLVVQLVKEVDRYLSLDASPDGQYLLVSAICKPYSYMNAYLRFPRNVEVWNISDRANITTQPVASLPLANRVPIRGVPLGPRNISWRANVPATLYWAEALDGGDWKVSVPARDKIMMLQAPFNAPVEITRTEYRFSLFQWGQHPDLTLLSEFDLNRSWRRTYLINIDKPETRRLLWNLSMDEKYKDPGTPVYRILPSGLSVIRQEENSIFLAGIGSSPDGDRPFLDRLDLDSLTTRRLFRSHKSCFEQFLAFDKSTTDTFLTRRESSDDPPNVLHRTLQAVIEVVPDGEATFTSESVAITHIPDPSPVIRQIKKRLVAYTREDGLELSFTLFTPPGYQEGTRVPTILYAYPRDFANASTAAQTTGSQATFTRLLKFQNLLLAGYAIIDRASFPIIGDPQKAYDTYLEQLVANAKAAVNEAVRLGVADPDRIGVTGHSHGALMAANLVAHSTLFRAGVATSGSYNKTLTPFGFQKERRSLWEAPDVYNKASPFFVADKIKTPLLIVHGADDANPGTTPLQGSKFYEAIRGNGGTTKLVLLPHEPHFYTARESKEHLVWEMLNWFGKYVKDV